MTTRHDGRKADQLRPVTITRHYIRHAEGSCLVEMGDTRVICTASVEERQPIWMRGQKRGWVTAEYGMLPRSTHDRTSREASRGKQGGRTLEIQRLIGRSLRAVTDLQKLGKRTVWIDCDVMQADGGTRCASITGAFVALLDACRSLQSQHRISELPTQDYVAAVSCGLVNGAPVMDLDYKEDSNCQADLNFIMTGGGKFIEIQGGAEDKPFDRQDLNNLT
ncbi:MAG: ribonuclease PH, partial [Magnetococcales bacterium]|nr:ribonuclease PH [Magnetococcales bacterium]